MTLHPTRGIFPLDSGNLEGGKTSPKRDFSAFLTSDFSQPGSPILVPVSLGHVADVSAS